MRRLIIVRHAIAEDKVQAAEHGTPDQQRALTEQGWRKFKKSAFGLWRLVPDLSAVLTSPLLRATETAELLLMPFGRRPIVMCPELAPDGDWRNFPHVLQQYSPDQCIACIGHEPLLGQLASWLVTGNERPILRFKKGGAALLELPDDAHAGEGKLLWLLSGGQLRRLGGDE